jgi:hypothetical protein
MNFNVTKSYLHAITDDVIEGHDFKDVRATVYSLDQLTLSNSFTYNSTNYSGGDWVRDQGDLGYPTGTMESRAFTIKGKASVSVSGSAVAVRIGLDPGMGKAYVLIDGVKPSLIAGLTTAVDVITCNATTIVPASLGQEIRDIVIADGLSDGVHTVELFCIDNTSTAFFIMHRIKAFSYNNKSVSSNGWVAPSADMPQGKKFTLKNIGADSIVNTTITVDAGLTYPNGTAIGTVSVGNLSPNSTFELNLLPKLIGNEVAGLKTYDLNLRSYIKDAAGTVPISNSIAAPYNSSAITYYGSWYEQAADATFPETSWGSANKYSWMQFTNYGDSFSMRVWRDSGLSAYRVMKNGISLNGCKITSGSPIVTVPSNAGLTVGMEIVMNGFATVPTTITAINGTAITMSANASATNTNRQAAFGNFVTTLTVSTSDPTLIQKFSLMTATGLGAGSNSVIVRIVANSGALFTTLNYTEAANYTQVDEVLQVKYDLKQVPPFPVKNVRLQNGKVVFDAPDKNAFNLDKTSPHDNRGGTQVEVEYRFPTFICCYAAGFLEKFKQYDIVITDPLALNRKQVKELQDLGIKVINYISFGEEDGEPANIWDYSSTKSPQIGNGQGPGGYASYYMSQGYNFGEVNECQNDNQRLFGQKTCALSNAHYLAGTGRCGTACTKDSRDGYIAQSAGGACAGGYTSANNWQRNATSACTNSACPKYTPTNTKCPQYQQAENSWGQDFSVGSNKPDANGIWGSYYIDAVKRGAGSWMERLQQHYMPLVFGVGSPKTETGVLLASHTTTTGSVIGVRASFYPIDSGEPITVSHTSTGFVYTINKHYTIDFKTGAIVFTTDPSDVDVPQALAGVAVSLAYTKMGLESDGVFMDTVDTVDVYNRADYQAGMAGIINDLKTQYSDKMFCANRGFSIYDQIVKSITYSMAESVFSDYNFDTGTYQLITDPGAIDWNNNIAEMMKELRKEHVFDVVCLNYAPNNSSGDAIRTEVFNKTLQLGWIPWLSEINLDVPLDNRPYLNATGAIRTNTWRKIDVVNI